MPKTILITGAAGFLGSHLCDRFIGEGFNVIGMDNYITGDPDEINILDFANEIMSLANLDLSIQYKPLPEEDPLKRQPDISLAKKVLNWQPRIKRDKGMLKTFEYFKALPKAKLLKVASKDFSKHIKS